MNDDISFAYLNGAYPSTVDGRDLVFSIPVNEDVSPVREKFVFDISKLRIRMQHKVGKCTGEASAKGSDVLFKFRSDDDASDDFIYLGTKDFIDGNRSEGSSARSVLKFLQKKGVCRRSRFEIPVTKDMTYAEYAKYQIPQSAFDEAEKFKIGKYYSVPLNKDIVKSALKKYGFLIARVEVSSTWYSPDWSPATTVPVRKGSPATGHLIFIYGFDETIDNNKMALLFSNSWSVMWGQSGNSYMFYEDNPPTELWAMTLEPVEKEPAKEDTRTISESVLNTFISILKSVGIKF